jgi:hypothetical protein
MHAVNPITAQVHPARTALRIRMRHLFALLKIGFLQLPDVRKKLHGSGSSSEPGTSYGFLR